MRLGPLIAGMALLLPAFGTTATKADAQESVRFGRGGSIEMGGRQVRCDNVRTRLDRRLPNLGAAAPDERLLLLNPLLLRRYNKTVQLFVFHHECGHHQVGASELNADCWAVRKGVLDGWLDRNGLGHVCRSFENAPETSTHPSGKRRCANLDRCFASAESEVLRVRGRAQSTAIRVAERTDGAEPKLVESPRLLWSSRVR